MKQNNMTAVDLIFENFNLRSDSDFKTWMLHTYEYLKNMEKQQILDAHEHGNSQYSVGVSYHIVAEEYYNKTYKE